MVIAIDYTPALHQRAGIGRLVRDLIAGLASVDAEHEFCLFAAGASGSPAAFPSNFKWATTLIPPVWLARAWYRAHIPLVVESFTGKIDLFHATDFTLPPVRSGTRTILTVHDLSFVRVPDAAPSRLRRYLNQVVPRSVQRADLVLADSVATRDDLIALYNAPADKVEVLYSGVDPRYQPINDPASYDRISKRYKLPSRPYLLTVGTVQPRKNYPRIVYALQQLERLNLNLDLVIVGQPGWLQDELYEAISRSGRMDRVHITGFVEDMDLPVLYSHALCLVFPSLYEGFGFPVLEAMASGVPVITSNVSSLPEVAGQAAILVDPYETDQIADAIQRVVTDDSLRASMIEQGFQQVAGFTWEHAARSLSRIYDRLL